MQAVQRGVRIVPRVGAKGLDRHVPDRRVGLFPAGPQPLPQPMVMFCKSSQYGRQKQELKVLSDRRKTLLA